MKQAFAVRHPIITSIIYLLILSLFSTATAILAISLGLSGIQLMFVQAGGFLLSIVVAAVIMAKSSYSAGEYGIRFPDTRVFSKALWFIPLILVEAITFIVGIDTSITLSYFMVVVLLMVVAVANEEIYFRGLILKTLRARGTGFAIALSSAFFALVHLGGLTAGRGLEHILLLVAFSGLFGFVCAEIVVLTRSILVPVIWHFTHNIISSITLEAAPDLTLIIVGIQSLLLLIYAVYLWKRIEEEKFASLEHNLFIPESQSPGG